MLFYYRLTGFMYNNLQNLYKNVHLVNLMAILYIFGRLYYIYVCLSKVLPYLKGFGPTCPVSAVNFTVMFYSPKMS